MNYVLADIGPRKRILPFKHDVARLMDGNYVMICLSYGHHADVCVRKDALDWFEEQAKRKNKEAVIFCAKIGHENQGWFITSEDVRNEDNSSYKDGFFWVHPQEAPPPTLEAVLQEEDGYKVNGLVTGGETSRESTALPEELVKAIAIRPRPRRKLLNILEFSSNPKWETVWKILEDHKELVFRPTGEVYLLNEEEKE